MLKAHSDPKCYIAGADGSLHWVVNEDVAERLFGQDWDNHIIWLEEALIYSYSFSYDINE